MTSNQELGPDDALLWLLEVAIRPLFTQAELLRIAGPNLAASTLQNWANRSILTAYIDRDRNSRRRYSGIQVIKVCLGLPLINELGIGPGLAMRSIQQAFATLFVGIANAHPEKITPDHKAIIMSLMADSICDTYVRQGPLALAAAKHCFAVVRSFDEGPTLVSDAKGVCAIAHDTPAALVFPLGRLLVELAERARGQVPLREFAGPET